MWGRGREIKHPVAIPRKKGPMCVLPFGDGRKSVPIFLIEFPPLKGKTKFSLFPLELWLTILMGPFAGPATRS